MWRRLPIIRLDDLVPSNVACDSKITRIPRGRSRKEHFGAKGPSRRRQLGLEQQQMTESLQNKIDFNGDSRKLLDLWRQRAGYEPFDFLLRIEVRRANERC